MYSLEYKVHGTSDNVVHLRIRYEEYRVVLLWAPLTPRRIVAVGSDADHIYFDFFKVILDFLNGVEMHEISKVKV